MIMGMLKKYISFFFSIYKHFQCITKPKAMDRLK
uniref:Uncharacterized protein n=1 Tax=Tetranychus urticae TaxID=32264 RepID=T1JVF0_TETUR